MVMDEKRRQKKLARKAAKRKKALAAKRGEIPGQGRLIAFAADKPLHECLIPRVLYDQGIGNVVISRKMPNGDIAAAFFLVDIYCLGVKNCFFTTMPPGAYAQRIANLVQKEGLEPAMPACVVKLIQGAVAYAEGLGLHAHRDYFSVKAFLGSIDPIPCPKEFEFGKDGKPFYISGPHETQADSERIIATLTRKLGSAGFHYMVGVDMGESVEEIGP
jgi:hypothetical protein